MRLIAVLGAATALAIAAPVAAQDQAMPGMDMPGMAMPAAKKEPPAKPAPEQSDKPAPKTDAGRMPGMDMAGSDKGNGAVPGMPGMAPAATALPAGNAPAPAPPMDHYADRSFPIAENARARARMMKEQGGQNFAMVLFNLAEFQVHDGRNGYRWEGEAWFGGDINRLVIKTEGEGAIRGGVDAAEVQALYSRLVGPYFSIQTGVRHDVRPSPARTYATIGFEGLSPYMVEVAGALFLSDKGDVLARLEAYHDARITQRLVLQPRVELNFAAQDVPENRIGSGLSNAELGLRLRYEIRREFAPYIGVSWDRRLGHTARFYRVAGEEPSSASLVAGIRMWL